MYCLKTVSRPQCTLEDPRRSQNWVDRWSWGDRAENLGRLRQPEFTGKSARQEWEGGINLEISRGAPLSYHLNTDHPIHANRERATKQGKSHQKVLEKQSLRFLEKILGESSSQSAEFSTGHLGRALKRVLSQCQGKTNLILNFVSTSLKINLKIRITKDENVSKKLNGTTRMRINSMYNK